MSDTSPSQVVSHHGAGRGRLLKKCAFNVDTPRRLPKQRCSLCRRGIGDQALRNFNEVRSMRSGKKNGSGFRSRTSCSLAAFQNRPRFRAHAVLIPSWGRRVLRPAPCFTRREFQLSRLEQKGRVGCEGPELHHHQAPQELLSRLGGSEP